ncbi:MAG: integrase family protein [bacterium]|nr:integrase family protein [bacterium]
MAVRALDTSITDATARRFLSGARERETLFCERITGFYLMKTKAGGSWRYRYQDASGKRRTATIGRYPTKKPQEAAGMALKWRNNDVDVLGDKERTRQAADLEAIQAKHRTVTKYLEGIYQKHQDRKKSGTETIGMIRHNFADWLDRDMATLSRSDVLEWQECREAEGRAHSTLQRAYGALKTMLRHATRQDPPILDVNPLEQVNLERPVDDERTEKLSASLAATRRLLTNDEIQSLHAGLDSFAEEIRAGRRNSRAHGKPQLPDLDAVAYPHWAIPFTYCALYTGLRPGDLYSLTWAELNITFGRVVKIPEKTRHHPAPAKIVMDLPSDLLDIMRGWWGQKGKPQAGLVFPSPVNQRRMDKKAHIKMWTHIKRLGGLPPALAFYSLRHHFISALVAAGVPLLTVARLVGHKSASMIEQHYGHLCPTAARDAMALLSQSVARKTEQAPEQEAGQ